MIPHPVFAALLLAAAPAVAANAPRPMAGVAEPFRTDAFDPDADPLAEVDAALAAARAANQRVLLVMGTGSCHDSAWLANLLSTERFAPVRARYRIVYADVGMPQTGFVRHPEVPKRFHLKVKGTPTVAVLDADGRLLNRKAAAKWRNAASRSDDDIYSELMDGAQQ